MIQVLELAKMLKVILTEFHMFRKLEKRFNTLSREKEVMKKTNIGLEDKNYNF